MATAWRRPIPARERVMLYGGGGAGKALALDTPIPTPRGWTTMGQIEPGMEVFDETGSVCLVEEVHPIIQGRDCYRVEFSDGSTIIADGEHLWSTETKNSRKAKGTETSAPQVRTTIEIAATLRVHQRGDLNHSIPTTKALVLPTRTLPLDPYLLGVWLGDGTGVASVITTTDQEILDEIRSRGYHIGNAYLSGHRTPQYRIHEGPDGRKVQTILREMGVFGDKHVPDEYLRGSREQRLDLLCGLMDTDGWVEHRGSCVVGFCNERLAAATYELVVSLGWRATRNKKPAKLNGVEVGTSHTVAFCPSEPPFKLSRKRDRLVPSGRVSRRMITEVVAVPSVPVRCIKVSSPSHLFLAGTAMIPTHNTYAALSMAARALGPDDYLFVIDYDNAVGTILGAAMTMEGHTFERLVIAEEWEGGTCIWENDQGGNVIVLHGDTWNDLDWIAKIMNARMTRDSWVLIDSITRLWEEVQNFYITTMHGEDMAEWLLEFKREQMVKQAGQNQDQAAIGLMLDGAWQVINKEWSQRVKNPLLTVPKHHVVVTAEEKAVRTASGDTGKDSEDLAGMYRYVGLKPDTQKSVGHKLATVVHVSKGKQREPVRRMTVVKDWGYEQNGLGEESEYTDMGVTMLKDMHGWKPKKVS